MRYRRLENPVLVNQAIADGADNKLKVHLLRQPEGEPRVKKYRVILSTVLLVLFLGVQTPQFAQDASTSLKNLTRKNTTMHSSSAS
jgi:hypothetical protein